MVEAVALAGETEAAAQEWSASPSVVGRLMSNIAGRTSDHAEQGTPCAAAHYAWLKAASDR
jgi:hypothetical protein